MFDFTASTAVEVFLRPSISLLRGVGQPEAGSSSGGESSENDKPLQSLQALRLLVYLANIKAQMTNVKLRKKGRHFCKIRSALFPL